MTQTIPFWNKVDVDNLTIDINEQEDRWFVKLYTNGVNIINKKFEVENSAEEIKNKLDNILDLMEKIATAYHSENYDEFKGKSNELLETIKLMS